MKNLIALIVGLLFAMQAIAAVPTDWSPHLGKDNVYRLDLAGTTPTSAHVAANNLQIGQVIIDTSNGTIYTMITTTPTFRTVSSAGAETVATLTVTNGLTIPAGGADITGDITLGNDEVIHNGDTDSEVEIEYNDDATTLGILTLKTTVDAANLADNDLFSIRAEAVDSASNATVYAKIDAKITDVTSTTEDASIIFNAFTGGSAGDLMTLAGTAVTLKNGAILDNSSSALLTITEATVDIDGASTATSYTSDANITSIGDMLCNGDDLTSDGTTFNIKALGAGGTVALATNVTVAGTLGVTGNTTLTGDIAVNGDDITSDGTTLNIAAQGAAGTVALATNVTVAGTLGVTGNTTLTGDIAVNGDDITSDGTTLNIKALGAAGTVAISTNASVAGTFDVVGAATAGSYASDAGVLASAGAFTSVQGGTTNIATVGPNAIAQLVIDYGTCTNGQTVAYVTPYSAAPSVLLTYREDAGADTVCEAVSITATNFVVQAAAAKQISWMSVGLK